jgi:WD40 repeat protein
VRTLAGHFGWVNAVAVTPDGKQAVSASNDQMLKVWNLRRGREVRTSVTPDGKQAVSASNDQMLKVWNLKRGREVRTLVGHSGWVHAVAVTPDGKKAVSASSDRTLRVWDLASGRTAATFTTDAEVLACAVAPDGITIVAGDRSGRLHFLRLIAH